MKLYTISTLCLLFLTISKYAFSDINKFEGELAFEPLGCETTQSCILKNSLRYTDPKAVVWQAEAGIKTDGASIPNWAQPFVGEPYDKSFIKAAVIHDHYCARHVRPWRQTHMAFYDALIDLGVPDDKSKLMYYAVYLAGPKWVELVRGNDCGSGCINSLGIISTNANPSNFMIRSSSFEQKGFVEDLKELEEELKKNADQISLEQLEKRAHSKRQHDIYYENSDTIKINKGVFYE